MTRSTVASARRAVAQPRLLLVDAFADLRRSRRAGWVLFNSNRRARHRRAWLGQLWIIGQVLATVAFAALIRAHGIVAFAATALPYPLFVLSGIVLWQTFVEGLNMPIQQLGGQRHLLARVAIPHETVLLAGFGDICLGLLTRSIILALVVAIYGVPITPSCLLVPLALSTAMVLGLALGLAAAPIGLLYDDVGRLLGVFSNVGMFLAPVLYPAPTGFFRLNPLTPLLNAERSGISGEAIAPDVLLVMVVAIVILLSAWLIYRVATPHITARTG